MKFRLASSAGTAALRVEPLPPRSLRPGEGRRTGEPVDLRQLPADGISRPVVFRRLRVQRVSAPRARTARLSRPAAACRRTPKPLLLAEAGADSIREGQDGQAAITAMHIRAAFDEGACGAVAFAGPTSGGAADSTSTTGRSVWSIASASRSRRQPRSRARLAMRRSRANEQENLAGRVGRGVRVQRRRHASRIACRRSNVSPTPTSKSFSSTTARAIAPEKSRASIRRFASSTSRTAASAHAQKRRPRTCDAARSSPIPTPIRASIRTGSRYLVQPFLTSDVVGSGGPNVVPADDPPMAQCIARAPGGPTHVLLDDRIAEHVPGCNMAFSARGAPRHRRVQSGLPPRRRRCGCVLATAGARLEDRLRCVGAGLASPSRRPSTPTGGSRSATAKASAG